jgi:beta-xylosidase
MPIPTVARVLLLALVLAGCGATPAPVPENPIIHNFVADPSAHVFDGRVYLFLTNDSANSGTYWDSRDWRLYSSADLVRWEDHGVPLAVDDLPWAEGLAWAPGAAERDGVYYFYFPVDRTKLGVARSDHPAGPYRDARGDPLVDKARDANAGDEPIDPMVYVDQDGQAYMYFGTRVPKVVRLARDMIHTEGPILDVALDTANYGEAPWLHERDGIYYFTYSTGWPGQIVYATGPGPMGPFTYQGVVLDYTSISTNHHAIVHHRGDWWLFYHEASLPGGGPHKRSVSVVPLVHEADGSIRPMTPVPGAAAREP